MPLKFFICPDGITRSIDQCLEECPRAEGRCLALPTLYELGHTRIWNGVASTTQLLNPTRQAYLMIVKDYAEDPKEGAFKLLGSRHHKRLEIIAKKLEGLIPEQKLKDATNTGILDLLEPDELNSGCWKITDYKTWGAYSVAKIMGVKHSNGYERRQATLQLNDYRIKAEHTLGLTISRLAVQCTVRDGGTHIARDQGIDFKMDMIYLDILPDDEVIEYFQDKNNALMQALKTNTRHCAPMTSDGVGGGVKALTLTTGI